MTSMFEGCFGRPVRLATIYEETAFEAYINFKITYE